MNTALHIAAGRGFSNCVQLLVKYGASLSTCNVHGWSPLSCAAAAGQVVVIHDLVSAGADVNHPDDEGHTPLMLALGSKQHVQVIRALVEVAADVDLAANDGRFPLLLAAEAGHLDALQVLT